MPLASSDYSVNDFVEPAGNVHVKLDSAVTNPAVPATVGTVTEKTLTLDTSAAAIDLTQNAGTTLTLSAGGLIKNGANAASISGGALPRPAAN